MSPLKSSLFAALASAVLTAGLLYYLNQQRAREATVLRRNNNQMRVQASQRHQAQVAALAPPARSAPARPEMIATPPEPTPVAAAENYRNEGRATPRATLHTFAWACDRADAALVSQMILLDPAARELAEALLAGLPEKERIKYGTVDEMAAAMLTLNVMAHPFPPAAVLEVAVIEPLGEDRAVLRLPGTAKDRSQFQKTGDGWKYVITDAMAEAYLKNSAAR
jgi:hypothetical protein